MNEQNSWQVYMVRCSDNTFYTGITTDLERRIKEHNSSMSKTRYTRSRRPVILAFMEGAANRSEASKRELQIKKMSRKKKEALAVLFKN